jgi:serine/threonine protein kinase
LTGAIVRFEPQAKAGDSGSKNAREPTPFARRYEILGQIGEGGMGTVYLCRLFSESGFRRLFALKILHRHLATDAVAARRFLEEAHLAGRMHHPNVVGIIDARIHAESEQSYVVMEYIEGASLRELLVASPLARPLQFVLPIMLDALSGLHATHALVDDHGNSLEVVHGDISPENILVGTDGTARVSDFGVARCATSDRTGTRPEEVFGKPPYIAPERFLGGSVGRRSDIFSIGVVLYEALTGVNPFQASSTDETIKRVCAGPRLPPSSLVRRLPLGIDSLCLKALERDPRRRFATADEMKRELYAIALREGLLAPAGEVGQWVRALAGRQIAQRRMLLLEPSPEKKPRAFVPGSGPPGRLARSPSTEPETFPDEVRARAPKRRRRVGRALVIVGSLAALSICLAGLIWPDFVSFALGYDTDGVSAQQTRAFPPPAPATSSKPRLTPGGTLRK